MADPVATTIVYMPARTLADLAATAIANGLDPAMPAVAIVKATRPGETVIAAPIRELPARLAEAPPGPVLVMIGRVFADIEAAQRSGVIPEAAQSAAVRNP